MQTSLNLFRFYRILLDTISETYQEEINVCYSTDTESPLHPEI